MGSTLGFALRSRVAARHVWHQGAVTLGWLARSRETTNFNYPLTALNRTHLAWWVSEATGVDVATIRGYFVELEADDELLDHLRQRTANSPYRRVSDARVHYGRRLAWYALVRVLRPVHVVETGTDKGLGTCVLAAAVRRNGRGLVTSVDITPDAGWLVAGAYADWVDQITGDSVAVLRTLARPIDLLVHDVHYTAEQEQAEYDAAFARLGPHPMILNDNAHSHGVLSEFAERLGWHCSVFRETPDRHWYPGGAMGLAWPR
jgi:predicted O-methyltransferase YrrM